MAKSQTSDTPSHAANIGEAVERPRHQSEEVPYYDVQTSTLKKVRIDPGQDQIAARKAFQKWLTDLANYGPPPLVYVSEPINNGLPQLAESTLYKAVMKEHRKRTPKETIAGSSLTGEVELGSPENGNKEPATPVATWAEVQYTLLANYKLKYSGAGAVLRTMLLSEIGLLDRKTGHPNRQFQVLSDIAGGRAFGAGRTVTDKEKTCKSKLCKLLRAITGLTGDPFFDRNEVDGYQPRFVLVDSRGDANRRAIRNSYHEEFHDTKSYDNEDDPAAKWLAERELQRRRVTRKSS
jgi:hypothetical protein